MQKKYVTISKGEEYSPLSEYADANGYVKLWYAYDEHGMAVTWNRTKVETMKEAREMGYSIRK